MAAKLADKTGSSDKADLSQGLDVDTLYGNKEIVTFTVLEAMDGSKNGATVDGVKYGNAVQGSNSAVIDANTGLPKSGAVFVINPVVDCTITFVTKNASGKKYHFRRASDKEDVSGDLVTGSLHFTCKAGETYYFYGEGTKPYVFGISWAAEESDIHVLDAVKLADVIIGSHDGRDEAFDDYFTILYDGGSKVETRDTAKNFADGYSSKNRINFAGPASTTGGAVKFTTTSIAAVKIWWGCATNAGRQMVILNENGGVVAVTSENSIKDGVYISQFKLTEPGTYYIGGATADAAPGVVGGKNYIYKLQVTEGLRERADWASVAEPSIVSATVDGDDATKIKVVVNALIGDDGADRVKVIMYGEDGKEAGNASSTTAGESATLYIKPVSTGNYTFKAVMSREDEKPDKESRVVGPVAFVLPLTAPEFSSAESLGGGKVQLVWGAVKEAEKYVVEVVDHAEIPMTEVEGTTATIEGLTVDETYSFTVYAVKGEERSAKSAPISCKVTAQRPFKWNFSRYGQNMDNKDSNSSYVKNSDNSVTITAKKGKIVPASTDGLAFYYTKLNPKTTNFTFTATAHVDSWTFSNGQEGFGIMAADRVGRDGNGSAFWNNSYQAMISKVSYRWDGEKITDDESAPKIEMEIGVGSTEKIGVKPQDLVEIANNDDVSVPPAFKSTQTAIDTTCAKYGAGSYNIVGNCTNPPTGSDKVQYTDFKLTIEKNNTGYFVSYTNPDGSTITKKYYDPEALSQLEENAVYVGFFASRGAKVTFKDFTLDTRSPEEDAAAEKQPITYLSPSNNVTSSNTTNASDYTLTFTSNWNGTAVVKDSVGNVIDTRQVTGSLDPEKSLLKDSDDNRDTKCYIELHDLVIGRNTYIIEFTPDRTWQPNSYTMLNSYDKAVITHTVEYRKYGEPGQTIYVSPNGKSTGTGTKENPLDVYTAVKYAQPGQTILLAGGNYSLNRTITVPRGIDGTKDNMIYMMGDPESSERPVFDFNDACPGMVTIGNYWYFKNFDVTRCVDGAKGIQVSGSYCVFDRVDAYKNGSTGLQISRAAATDTYKDWPHDNLILNCNAYLNADAGYEDADGFAAKLTSGSNNVFDGCIAAYNADDGWDLFAKVQSGNIGAVTIRNSIAYKNGYVLRSDNGKGGLNERGTQVDAGNGNGFKMGGDGLAGGTEADPDFGASSGIKRSGHKLINSLAFYNKSKGFDSNSSPNVKIYDSISFNNGKENIGLSTYSTNNHTDYELRNVVSFRTSNMSTGDSISTRGNQDASKVNNDTVYKWDKNSKTSKNKSGATITADNFVSLTYESLDYIDPSYYRNADGTINTHGFLTLKEGVAVAPGMGGTPSQDVTPGDLTDGNVSLGSSEVKDDSDNDYGKDYPEGGVATLAKYYGKIWVAEINALDYTCEEEIVYTGKAVKPEVHVRYSADTPLLKQGRDYSIAYRNNVNAYLAGGEGYDPSMAPTVIITGKGNYAGLTATKTFEIKPVDINDNTVAVSDAAVIVNDKPQTANPVVTFAGRKLTVNKDYWLDKNATQSAAGTYEVTLKGINNFTGSKTIQYTLVGKTDTSHVLMSKASVKLVAGQKIVYNGASQTPEVEVNYQGKTLTLQTEEKQGDYTLVYANNIEIGKATVMVVGTGTKYVGSKSLTFNIKGGSLKEATVSSTVLDKYIEQGNQRQLIYKGERLTVPEGNIKVSMNGVTLRNGVDYKIIQKGTDQAGTATVTVKGINGYTGQQVFRYKIAACDIGKLPDSCFLYTAELPYTAGGVKYTAGKNFRLIIDGREVSSKNYSLGYKNNNLVAGAGTAKAPTIVVKGVKGLKGTKELTFGIVKSDMSEPTNGISVTAPDIATNGRTNIKYSDLKKSRISVMQTVNGKSRKLSLNRDYGTIEYYLDKNENYEIDDGDERLDINSRTPFAAGEAALQEDGSFAVLVRVYADRKATCSYQEGSYVDSFFRVALYDIRTVNVKDIPVRTFGEYNEGNGKTVTIAWDDTNNKLTGAVKDDKNKTDGKPTVLECRDYIGGYAVHPSKLEDDGYVIVPGSYKNNNRVGTAKFTIRGSGKYAGTKEVPFRIYNSRTINMTDPSNGISVTAADIATNGGTAVRYSDLKKSRIGVIQTSDRVVRKLSAGRDYDKIEYFFDRNGDYKIDEGDQLLDIKSKQLFEAGNAELKAGRGFTVLVRVYASEKFNCNYRIGSYADGYFRVSLYDIKAVTAKDIPTRCIEEEYGTINPEFMRFVWDDTDHTLAGVVKDDKNKTDGRTTVLECQDYVGGYISDTSKLGLDGYVIVPDSYKNNTKAGTAKFTIRGTGKYAGTKEISFKIVERKTAGK